MRATATQGHELDLKQDTFDGLKTRLRGPVLLPGELGYEESRTVWNAMIDRKPVAVARCLGIADVIACVRFARENDILLSIKAFGTPIGDVLVRRPYTQLQALLDGTQPKGRRYYWKSEYLPRIDPDLCAKAIEHAQRIGSPHSAVILFQIGGALNQLEQEHSPVGNRDARYVLNVASSWEQAADDAANIAWTRDAWNDLKAFSTGGTYINFLTEDEGRDRIEAALGEGLQRLAEVKARWDPHNVFRTNRNITPA